MTIRLLFWERVREYQHGAGRTAKCFFCSNAKFVQNSLAFWYVIISKNISRIYKYTNHIFSKVCNKLHRNDGKFFELWNKCHENIALFFRAKIESNDDNKDSCPCLWQLSGESLRPTQLFRQQKGQRNRNPHPFIQLCYWGLMIVPQNINYCMGWRNSGGNFDIMVWWYRGLNGSSVSKKSSNVSKVHPKICCSSISRLHVAPTFRVYHHHIYVRAKRLNGAWLPVTLPALSTYCVTIAVNLEPAPCFHKSYLLKFCGYWQCGRASLECIKGPCWLSVRD